MSLLFPGMLFAALGAGVPVILHLIQRQQFPPRRVATVRFLPKDRRVNRFAMRLVDPIQLALRVAVLLAVVLVMVRPLVGLGKSAPRNFVIVLDTSMSMGATAEGDGESALAQAQGHVKAMLQELGTRDEVGLVVAADSVAGTIPLTREREPIEAAIANAKITERGSSGVVSGIIRAGEMLARRRECANVIFVLTDLCSNLFGPAQGEAVQRVRSLLGGGGTELRLVQFGAPEPTNATITDCSLTPRSAVVGASVKLSPRVHNHSAEERRITADLRVRGLPAGTARPVTIPPGGECVLDLVTLYRTRGSSYATVSLSPDDLDRDNSFSLPLRPSPRREVLIVSGVGKEEAASEDDPVEISVPTVISYALNPAFSLSGETGTNLRPKPIRSDAIGTVALDRYQLYILCGVSSLPDQVLQDLRSLIARSRDQRGLIIVPDEEMNALRFNELFRAVGGSENLPLTAAGLGPVVPCEPPLRWAASASQSPILAPFREQSGLAEPIRMFRRFELTPESNAEVFLSATDGSPLGVVMAYGRGRIATLGFSFTPADTNLIRTPAMLSFIWQLSDYLTGRTVQRPLEETKVGRQAVLDLSDLHGIHGRARLRRVGDDEVEPTFFSLEDQKEQVVQRFPEAGVYELGHEKRYQDRNRFVAVNVSPGEGDLSRLSEEQLKEALGSVGWSRCSPEDAMEGIRVGTELWPWVLALLIVLFGLEAICGLVLSLRKKEIKES